MKKNILVESLLLVAFVLLVFEVVALTQNVFFSPSISVSPTLLPRAHPSASTTPLPSLSATPLAISTTIFPAVKVAFIGDQGLNDGSKAVLRLIKNEGAEAVFHQGDFDYADNPTAWDEQITSILGKDFPYFSTIGNHDLNKWTGYQALIQARMSRIKDIKCSGDIGAKSTCTYKGLSYNSVAPGIFRDDYVGYLKSTLSSQSNTWKICGWHEDQKLMQLGEKSDEVGWGVYEACKDAGAIIATAHEHSYSRSYLMDNIEHQHVVSTSSTLQIGPGKTFVFVSGLGGKDVRVQILSNPWWAAVYTATQHANPGALFCTFNVGGDEHKASCYFKDIRGKVPDKFDIVRQ